MIFFFSLEASGAEEAPLIDDISFGKRNVDFCRDLDAATRTGNAEEFLRTLNRVSDWPQFVDVRGGREWSDILTPTNSSHGLMVSQRVIEDWAEAGILGYTVTPRAIRKVGSKALKLQKPKFYFEVEPEGEVRFRYRFFERLDKQFVFRFATDDPEGEPRARFMAEGYVQHQQLEPISETWDHRDLIKTPGHGRGGTFGRCFCSRRLVELARRKQWSNFSFAPIDAVGCRGGDFRELPWPPERWYPENHPPSA